MARDRARRPVGGASGKEIGSGGFRLGSGWCDRSSALRPAHLLADENDPWSAPSAAGPWVCSLELAPGADAVRRPRVAGRLPQGRARGLTFLRST